MISKCLLRDLNNNGKKKHQNKCSVMVMAATISFKISKTFMPVCKVQAKCYKGINYLFNKLFDFCCQ